MKKIIQVVEEENEGLVSLLGKRVLIMSAGYFYEGELEGVNDTCIKLKDPKIVYSTGDWSDKAYSDVQPMHADSWYISIGLIESFGLSKDDK